MKDNTFIFPHDDEDAIEEICEHIVNAEIATELGWRFSEADQCWIRDDDESDFVPDYLNDLNLCQDIYNDLREDEEIIYANILTSIINNGIISEGQGFRPCPLIFANARQRCQAFVILREI